MTNLSLLEVPHFLLHNSNCRLNRGLLWQRGPVIQRLLWNCRRHLQACNTLLMDWRLTSASKTRWWACVDPQYISWSFTSCRKRTLWWNFVGIENSRTFPPKSCPRWDKTIKHRRFLFYMNWMSSKSIEMLECWNVTLTDKSSSGRNKGRGCRG